MSRLGPIDHVIAALAARQHGVVSAAQLVAAGVPRKAIKHRVASRRLTQLHRGVYRVGPNHTALTTLMAAALAYGPCSVISHRSAAALHGLRKLGADPVDVTVTTNRRAQKGVRVHRRKLGPDEITNVHGIPTTTVERTIQDLATTAPIHEVERAIEEAQIQRKLSPAALSDVVEKAAGRRGAPALRAAATNEEPQLTRSEPERKLQALIRRAGLPRPRTNMKIGPWEVDVLWPEQKLVVEVDGYAFHSSRQAFERDRRKDAALQALGFTVLRITWRQLAREPESVVAAVAAALVR